MLTPKRLLPPLLILKGYAESILEQTGPVANIKSYVLRRLAHERLDATAIFDAFSDADRDDIRGLPDPFPKKAECSTRIDELIVSEGSRLTRGEIEPQLAWFLLDFHRRVVEVLGDEDEIEGAEHQRREIEYIHSQQLALLLAPIVQDVLDRYFTDADEVQFTEIGAKNGDLIGRIDHELKKKSLGIQTRAYDITPEKPLGPEFAAKYSQPDSSTIPVSRANLLDINGSISHPVDVLLLSNILHKISPEAHVKALEEAYEKLSPGGVVIINTPFFSDVDETVLRKTFYQICDGTEYKDALLSWEQWKDVINDTEFEIVDEKDFGFKASLLDGFSHRVIILRKPIS